MSKRNCPGSGGGGDAELAEHTTPVKPVAAVFPAKMQQRELQQRLSRQGQGAFLEQLRMHTGNTSSLNSKCFRLLEASVANRMATSISVRSML